MSDTTEPVPTEGGTPPSVSATKRFLAAVRRRLRLVWAWSTGSLVAPVVATVALLLVLLGRFRPWAWPEQGALIVALIALGALLVATVLQPLSPMVAARAVDRSMNTKDIFSSALQFESLEDSFGQEIRRRAEHEAADGRPSDALPLASDRATIGRWLVAGAMGATAIVLALVVTNPQDAERRRLEAVAVQAEEAVEEIEELAAEAEQAGNDELSETLSELAQDLGDVTSLEEATELVEDAIEELQTQRDLNFSSQEAAVEGLQRSLEAEPFPGVDAEAEGGADAASQLEDLAEGLDGLSESEQADLAERLAELAEGQQAGDPATAEQLNEAAEALAAGDLAGAQAALGEAAAAQGAAADSVAGQQAADQAAEALGQLLQGEGNGQAGEGAQGPVDCPDPDELDDLEQPDPDAPAEAIGPVHTAVRPRVATLFITFGPASEPALELAQGEIPPECVGGQGQGQGQGAGQGQGQGQGAGQGAGEGQGQGAGGGQGEVSGSDALNGGAAQGGVGTPDGGEQTRREGDNSGSSIVDPNALESGDPLDLGGTLSNDGSTETVGEGDGLTTSGGSRVPVSDVVGDYADRASRAADSSRLPPSQQELVGDYFDVLTQGGGQ